MGEGKAFCVDGARARGDREVGPEILIVNMELVVELGVIKNEVSQR